MKVELNIPTSLDDITLSSFQKYLKISETNKDGNFLKHKAIEIFCGVPLLTVSNMRQLDVDEINNKIGAILETSPKLQQKFVMDGVLFGFIPNLENMTAGEYIDLDTYIKSPQTLHKALAVLYRPITTNFKDKYLIEPYEGSDKYSDKMKNVNLQIALGASVFFWTLAKDLLISLTSYLQENQQEIQTTLNKHNLDKNGDGIHQFTQQLREILETSKMLLN